MCECVLVCWIIPGHGCAPPFALYGSSVCVATLVAWLLAVCSFVPRSVAFHDEDHSLDALKKRLRARPRRWDCHGARLQAGSGGARPPRRRVGVRSYTTLTYIRGVSWTALPRFNGSVHSRRTGPSCARARRARAASSLGSSKNGQMTTPLQTS